MQPNKPRVENFNFSTLKSIEEQRSHIYEKLSSALAGARDLDLFRVSAEVGGIAAEQRTASNRDVIHGIFLNLFYIMDSSIFLLRQYGLIDNKNENKTALKPCAPSTSTILSSAVPTFMNAIWLKEGTFFNENLHKRWYTVYRCGVYDDEGNLLLITNKIWNTFKHTGFPLSKFAMTRPLSGEWYSKLSQRTRKTLRLTCCM